MNVSPTVRNAGPIQAVLEQELPGCHDLLEIGSGQGIHAVRFATAFPDLSWQTSEIPAALPALKQSLRAKEISLPEPIELDVDDYKGETASLDAMYSCNTAHIMREDSAHRLIELAGRLLRPNGVLCLYGPFSIGGIFNTESNENFDRSLRSRGLGMGIRDLDDLDGTASRNGLCRMRLYAMPANNYLVVWQRESVADKRLISQ